MHTGREQIGPVPKHSGTTRYHSLPVAVASAREWWVENRPVPAGIS